MWSAWLLVSATSCVKTAECDASVPCDSGEVCYDYQCHGICEVADDCGAGATCVPCLQDDAQGTVDHCFAATVFACILETPS